MDATKNTYCYKTMLKKYGQVEIILMAKHIAKHKKVFQNFKKASQSIEFPSCDVKPW